MYLIRFASVVLVTFLFFAASTFASEWSIPLAGNVFRTSPSVGNAGIRKEMLAIGDSAEVYSIFFRVDKPALLDISILGRTSAEPSSLSVTYGATSYDVSLLGNELAVQHVGKIDIAEAGYCRIDLKATSREGAGRTTKATAELKELRVASETSGLTLDFVKTNDGQMFYWGRRGPSVHLRYDVPRDLKIEYSYSEITVPVGQDPIGSYFMANGFGEGYFGIQVNSEKERRVLFSVWSPFQTDNPKDIPLDQRIVPLAEGPEVKLGEFGNEGSGGQSFLVYPWKSGKTYKFLTQVKPDGEGNTVYASWFGEADSEEWRLIARFRRPKTNTHYTGFHSFLENFDPSRGHLERRGLHGNVWVRDIDAQWHECTQARFSVDPTGKGRHRLDYGGGGDGDAFFLKNGGFFNETTSPGAIFQRRSTAANMPKIDFQSLP